MNRILSAAAAVALAAVAPAQLTCTVTSCGSSCGPALSLSFTPQGANGNHTVALQASGLHANALMAISWADVTTYAQLPGGCSVLIVPVWSELHTTNSTGSFGWSRTWPHWAVAQYHMQAASIEVYANGSYDVKTTECQTGACF